MKNLFLAILAIFVACFAAGAQEKGPSPSCSLVPGWTQSGAPRTYDADNLFEYMDGNAEGYIAYNFQTMHGVTCQKGGVSFVVDISEMSDADFAFGMFTANRDTRQPEYKAGAGGQIVPRRLIFAKGKYYAEIAANPEGDHTAELKLWAAALEKLIPGNSAPPPALTWFPAAKQQSLKLSPESVLGLRILRQGYVAQYDFGKAFVVFEETTETAAEVMKKLRERYPENTAAKLADDAFQTADKYLGKLYFFRKGKYIGGYSVTAEGTDPAPLAAALAQKIQ